MLLSHHCPFTHTPSKTVCPTGPYFIGISLREILQPVETHFLKNWAFVLLYFLVDRRSNNRRIVSWRCSSGLSHQHLKQFVDFCFVRRLYLSRFRSMWLWPGWLWLFCWSPCRLCLSAAPNNLACINLVVPTAVSPVILRWILQTDHDFSWSAWRTSHTFSWRAFGLRRRFGPLRPSPTTRSYYPCRNNLCLHVRNVLDDHV